MFIRLCVLVERCKCCFFIIRAYVRAMYKVSSAFGADEDVEPLGAGLAEVPSPPQPSGAAEVPRRGRGQRAAGAEPPGARAAPKLSLAGDFQHGVTRLCPCCNTEVESALAESIS